MFRGRSSWHGIGLDNFNSFFVELSSFILSDEDVLKFVCSSEKRHSEVDLGDCSKEFEEFRDESGAGAAGQGTDSEDEDPGEDHSCVVLCFAHVFLSELHKETQSVQGHQGKNKKVNDEK